MIRHWSLLGCCMGNLKWPSFTLETSDSIHEEGLLQVNIPSSLTEIPTGAFEYCNQVVMVAIPESVTLIGGRAFLNCKSLERITIPESVATIGQRAFLNCESLGKHHYPKVRDIHWRCRLSIFQVFWQALLSLSLSPASKKVPLQIASLWQVSLSPSLWRPVRRVPLQVALLWWASVSLRVWRPFETAPFFGCSSLGTITVPQSLTLIGDGAFDNKLHVENRRIWLYWFATVGTWFFTFELASMGQCSPNDQLSIITNSRAKKMATVCFGIGKSTQLLQLNYPAHKSYIDWYMYPYGLPSPTIPYLHLSPSFAWQPVRTSWDTM